MTLQQAFKEYADFARESEQAVFKYRNCFSKLFHQELKEQIFKLNEKIFENFLNKFYILIKVW